ncbi:MAG: hypothetical protein RIQ34_1095 [Bacteroidota bacterium]|jgi:cytochrome c
MKPIFLFLAATSLVWMACGDAPTSSSETNSVDVTKDPAYKTGLALVSKSDCATCHKVDEQMTGPSYRDIAAKYAKATDAEVSQVAQKIIKGGGGVWGEVPMTPHPAIVEADAVAMVEYIRLLKK